MSNIEIKERISQLDNDYLIRLIGMYHPDLKTAFSAWLADYSDGFKSVSEALNLFKKEFNH